MAATGGDGVDESATLVVVTTGSGGVRSVGPGDSPRIT